MLLLLLWRVLLLWWVLGVLGIQRLLGVMLLLLLRIGLLLLGVRLAIRLRHRDRREGRIAVLLWGWRCSGVHHYHVLNVGARRGAVYGALVLEDNVTQRMAT